MKQGHKLSELSYHAKWFPIGPILALILCVAVIVGQDPQSFFSGHWEQVLVTYISVPLVLVLYLGYKFKKHTKLIPLDQVDVSPVHKDGTLKESSTKD